MPYIGRDLSRGNYLKLDDISSSFNGSETTFNLTNGGQAFYPGSAFSILVVLAGVVQEPESAYQIDQSEITFASAPIAGDSFFCIVLGTALGINVPGNGTVGGTQLTKPFSYDGFFYLNDTTNRVGINSSSPTTALDVQGTVTATQFVGNLLNTSGISTFNNLRVSGDLTVEGTTTTLDTIVTEVDKLEVGANNTTVGVAITQSGAGDILRLYDSSTQVVTVKDGGNVGINTTDVTHQVTVVSSSANNTIARFKAANLNSNFDIVTDASSHGAAYVKNNLGASKVALLSNGRSYFTGGSVGIGTDNPDYLLHVGTATTSLYVVGQSQLNRVAITTTSSNITLETGRTYVYYSSVTLTLPASPTVGDRLEVINRSGTITGVLARNGSNIMGAAANLDLDVIDAAFKVTYSNSSDGWVVST